MIRIRAERLALIQGKGKRRLCRHGLLCGFIKRHTRIFNGNKGRCSHFEYETTLDAAGAVLLIPGLRSAFCG